MKKHIVKLAVILTALALLAGVVFAATTAATTSPEIDEETWVQEFFTIPTHIEDEMIAAGFSEFERRQMVSRAAIVSLDIETFWNMIQSGMTADEIHYEQMAIIHRESDLLGRFIHSDMSIESFVAQLERGNEATISELLDFVVTRRRETREYFIEISGISEDEMELAHQMGVTNPIDMSQAKSISTHFELDFVDVVQMRLQGMQGIQRAQGREWHYTDWHYIVADLSGVTIEEFRAEWGID